MTKPTITYLIGYPGVGKLTVAKAMQEKSNAILVDNHLINNPIFNVIVADGKTPIPDAAWDRIDQIRDIVLGSIIEIAPQNANYIFTNELLDTPDDLLLFEKIENLAKKRNNLFIPVILHCEEEEQCRRVISPERKDNMKDTSISNLKEALHTTELLPITHKNTLRLDTTHLSPKDTAQKILEHTAQC